MLLAPLIKKSELLFHFCRCELLLTDCKDGSLVIFDAGSFEWKCLVDVVELVTPATDFIKQLLLDANVRICFIGLLHSETAQVARDECTHIDTINSINLITIN